MQIAVIDANQLKTTGQGNIQLGFVVHFHQHIKLIVGGTGCQFTQANRIQCCHNQQDTVRTDSTGFCNLIRVNDEILSYHRQLTRGPGLLQIGIAALKILLIGQHRQTGRSTLGILARQGSGIEIFTNQPLAGRGFFNLGDHRRLLGIHALSHRADKATALSQQITRQLVLHRH